MKPGHWQHMNCCSSEPHFKLVCPDFDAAQIIKFVFHFKMSMATIFCYIILFSTASSSEAAKLRPWLGPNIFFEGQMPIRVTHGFAATGDGKLWIFGGQAVAGEEVRALASKIASDTMFLTVANFPCSLYRN